jgi:hypothetical protein
VTTTWYDAIESMPEIDEKNIIGKKRVVCTKTLVKGKIEVCVYKRIEIFVEGRVK